jgi:hypothetical protein
MAADIASDGILVDVSCSLSGGYTPVLAENCRPHSSLLIRSHCVEALAIHPAPWCVGITEMVGKRRSSCSCAFV